MNIIRRTDNTGKKRRRLVLVSAAAFAVAAFLLTGCDESAEQGSAKKTENGAARDNIVDYFGDLEIVRAAYYNTMDNAGFRTEAERALVDTVYKMMQAEEITGEQYREEFMPVINQAAIERTELAKERAAAGIYDPATGEYTLPEDRLPGFVEALRGLETEGHFGADYYWGGKQGIRLYTEAGDFIEYDGTKLQLYSGGESKRSAFRSVKGGAFWNHVEPWFPEVRYGVLMGDPWNRDTPMEEPDVEAALTEEERARILAEEVAAFDGTWLNGKVDYRGILGFTEDMAAYAGTAEAGR